MKNQSRQPRLSSASGCLIPAKLQRPRLQSWQIHRHEALQKLDQTLNHRIGLIKAPAGYGKSTLLAQWCADLSDRSVRFGWLSLDESDSDTNTFLSYLLATFEDDPNQINLLEQKFRQSLDTRLADRVIALLSTKISKFLTETVLILDDYHRAESAEINKILTRLVEATPDNFHLVIATRESPNIAISTLKAQEKLVLLETKDIRFTLDEASSFLTKKLPYELSQEQSLKLWKKTEGWPLALQTARLWIESNSAKIDLINTFSGRLTDISDYLNEQVMAELPADVQLFLMETSVLEQISGDIANAVCEREDSWEIIEGLARRNLFLIAQDKEGRCYRYHHLFSEFLLERFKRLNPEKVEALMVRAALWHAERNHLREAINYYLLSGNINSAAQLIEKEGGWRLVFSGHISILRYLFKNIPEEITKKYPRLLLAYIYLCAKSGKMELAQQHLKSWDEACYDLKEDTLLKTERLLFEKLLSGYRDELVTLDEVDELRKYAQNLQKSDTVLLALIHNYLCSFYFDICHFDNAKEAAKSSIELFEANGNHYSSYILNLYLGLINFSMGNLQGAMRIYKKTHNEMENKYGDDSDAVFISSVLLAEAQYERNDLVAAEKALEESLHHIEEFDGWFDIYASGYMTKSAVVFHKEGLDQALDVLDRAEQTAERRSIKKLGALIQYQRINLLTLSGRLDSASLIAESMQETNASSQHIRLRHSRGVALARLAIYQENYTVGKALLPGLLAEAKQLSWKRQTIKLLLIQSLSFFKSGEYEKGAKSLNEALVIGSIEKFCRSFLDEGDILTRYIKRTLLKGESFSKDATNFAKSLLSAKIIPGNIDVESAQHSNISKREQEVLQLISDGLSNKQIAFHLGISESTVKFHKKNIYTKLKVNNRAAALAEARKLSLV